MTGSRLFVLYLTYALCVPRVGNLENTQTVMGKDYGVFTP